MNAYPIMNNAQIDSLISHRTHSTRMLRRVDYLALCPTRRPALKRELISIQERLTAATVAPRRGRIA